MTRGSIGKIVAEHHNSEGERITIEECLDGSGYDGQRVLVIYDDLPPRGTSTPAPTLLDEGTVAWLQEVIA